MAGKMLVGAAVAASVLIGTAAAPPQSNWRRLDSPNFIVIGEVGARELRDIAVKFEGFRETLGRVLNERATSTAVPTVVMVFRGDATFAPFRPRFQGKRVDVGGLFVPRRDVNYIAMVSDGNASRDRVIFHEYAHLLIANTGHRVPVWLNEGLAEYYSTFELERGREAIIGRFIEGHLARLNDTTLLKLPDLLGVTHDSPLYNEGNRRSVFYAQAWALTHLILRSQPSRVPQLSAYLEHLSRGIAPPEAWQQAFGAENLGRELEAYIRRRAYTHTRYKFTDAIANFEAAAVPIPPADLQAYQADFLVQLREFDEAAVRLAASAKADPTSIRASLAAASLAMARKDFGAAENRVRAAGNISDWYLNYLSGVLLVAAIEGRGGKATPDDLETARRLFSLARADRPEFANALARMAALELHSVSGPTPTTRELLERARSAAPGRHEYAMLLAQVLARQSEFALARRVLGPLMASTYPVEVRESAKSLMTYVVELEARRAGRPSSTAGPGSAITSTPSSATEVEAPVTRPLFREPRPGEQRLEGLLEDIGCAAGKGVTFRVRSGSEIVTVTSPDLPSVDFITYRTDLTSSIQCGAMKPALPVYVTWRAGAAAGSKVAVALEFLPPKSP